MVDGRHPGCAWPAHPVLQEQLEKPNRLPGSRLSGTVAVEPKTHHCALDIHLMLVKDQKLTIIDTAKQRPPSDTAQYCDLEKNPNDNKQYEVKI